MPDDRKCYELLKGELVEISHQEKPMVCTFPVSIVCWAILSKRTTLELLVLKVDSISNETRIQIWKGIAKSFLCWLGEVISPDDTYTVVAEKVEEYLQTGVRRVWVVDPKRRTVTVYLGQTRWGRMAC